LILLCFICETGNFLEIPATSATAYFFRTFQKFHIGSYFEKKKFAFIFNDLLLIPSNLIKIVESFLF